MRESGGRQPLVKKYFQVVVAGELGDLAASVDVFVEVDRHLDEIRIGLFAGCASATRRVSGS